MALDPTAQDHYPEERVSRARSLAARSPIPAQIGNIRFGSASWTDPTLVKSRLFYPPTARSPEARLRYYCERFSMVEVDASYYALPTRRQAALWRDRSPVTFVFNIKAFSSLTYHPTRLDRLPKDLQENLSRRLLGRRRARHEELGDVLDAELLRRFVSAIEPLRDAGKLGSVLLQFPPWFEATRGNVRKLIRRREQLSDWPLAVEFRHRSWLAPTRWERVQALLRDYALSYVGVDSPGHCETALPSAVVVTNPKLAMLRFHGRNKATWSRPVSSAAERFDHLYSEEELSEWIEPIQRLSDEAEDVHVVMNNCTYDAAQLSAYGIAALVQGSYSAREARRIQVTTSSS